VSVQIWIPLLFLIIGLYHGVTAWREYQRAEATPTPLFKAKSRIAGIFKIISFLLLIFL
jgi:hypothetical protein